jgi:gluconokinase
VSLVFALDIGTGSTKALVLDNQGNQYYSARAGYDTLFPQPGFAEQDPEEILQSVQKLIRNCPDKIKEQLTLISLSSAMHSLMAVDKHGKPLTNLILWSDLRSKEESRFIRDRNELMDQLVLTGTPVHPMSPLCKIMWLRKNQPEIVKHTHKFIGIKEFIWHNLFQEFSTDQGIASASGLLQTGTLNWFKPSLELAGIEEANLSKPVSVYYKKQLCDPDILKSYGLSKPTDFLIGGSDGCLANLGSNALDNHSLSLTIGTSGAIRRTINNLKSRGSSHGLFLYHLDESTFIEGGATNNGANLIDWFSNTFLKQKVDLISFVKQADTVTAGSEGLLFLPFVYGERSPYYDPDARGVFYGMQQHHTLTHFMKAVLEGISFALYSIAERIESSSGSYDHVIASGGFTYASEWVQLIADIFGKTVEVKSMEDASAIGAAILGFRSLRIQYNHPERERKYFSPDREKHLKYQQMYPLYRNLAGHLSQYFFENRSGSVQ